MINSTNVKDLIPRPVRKIAKRFQILHDLSKIVDQIGERSIPEKEKFAIPHWYEFNLCEPTVQHPIRDFCKPGDIVFDVGANSGALSVLMSRLVGPKGTVCSFEASPRIIDKTQHNLVVNGCSNTQLFNCAVYSKSNEVLKIYAGSHLNDSIITSTPASQSWDVTTITLDDFSNHFKLTPKLIKMDIEEAEFDALQGMKELLKKSHPILILEQQTSDARCLTFLAKHGYRALDLSSYEEIKNISDFPKGMGLANVLFMHESDAEESPYFETTKKTVKEFDISDFDQDDVNGIKLKREFTLKPGRYICEADFSADGQDNQAHCGVEADGKTIFRYHTFAAFLASSYRHWVIDLSRPTRINFFFRFLFGTRDSTLKFRGIEVRELTALGDLPRFSLN